MDAFRTGRCLPGAIAAMLLSLAACQPSAPPGPPPAPPTALMLIDSPPPDYPLELACDEIGGQVVLMVSVGTDGRPSKIDLVKSSRVPALDAAAQQGVTRWRFEPATRNGQPVPGKLQVPVKFTPPAQRPAHCDNAPAR